MAHLAKSKAQMQWNGWTFNVKFSLVKYHNDFPLGATHRVGFFPYLKDMFPKLFGAGNPSLRRHELDFAIVKLVRLSIELSLFLTGQLPRPYKRMFNVEYRLYHQVRRMGRFEKVSVLL